MKKRNRLTICLVAGVLILAVSATAAFGSVNGYSKYKEAVKALALETDNFTANGTLKMICDGKEVVHVTEDYAMDGHNMSSHSISKDSMGSHEQYETILNGVNTWFDVNDRYYYQSEYETDSSSLGGNLLGVDQDDEMARRMVNFMEIAADTVVGELKNNFVQVGKENGATLYQVEIAKNQVPSLVNAGLSLFAYSVGQSHDYDYTVNYEDYSATAIQNYEKVTGETLPETFKEGYINNGGNEQWYEAVPYLFEFYDCPGVQRSVQRNAHAGFALRYGGVADRHYPEARFPELFTHFDGAVVLPGHQRYDVRRGRRTGQSMRQKVQVFPPRLHLRQSPDNVVRPA